ARRGWSRTVAVRAPGARAAVVRAGGACSGRTARARVSRRVAGEAFYWAPGHAPEALEDCEYVDLSPRKEFEEVIGHVKSNLG
ncbi:hypothetical protein PV398_43975, partial [Streptomyces ipomoeae]|nr:hypothetical protein [Streptomyces ipomoeae]